MTATIQQVVYDLLNALANARTAATTCISATSFKASVTAMQIGKDSLACLNA